MKNILVVGAGIGGLATAAALSKLGFPITVLEAHVYAGGCSGTFYHQGFRFDAGATLAAGFYHGGPMDLVAKAAGIDDWNGRPSDIAMVVHMPGGEIIPRWGNEYRHAAYKNAFGDTAMRFWRWQEKIADSLWDLAQRLPAWPPQSVRQAFELGSTGVNWLSEDLIRRFRPGMLADAFRPVSHHLRDAPEELRQFIDAQLLISAQTTSEFTNALYGASALDLPRRGVRIFEGGVGSIADRLVHAIRNNGGKVLFHQEVKQVLSNSNRSYQVLTQQGLDFPADLVVFNLPSSNILDILGDHSPGNLRRIAGRPMIGWGAFTMYVGLEASCIPADFPLHHHILTDRGLTEAKSIFLSLSPEWDTTRGPRGMRGITISSHTQTSHWWDLIQKNPEGYSAKKSQYMERMLQAASLAIPDIRDAAQLILPGTPITFERYTNRTKGWVGGFPQTNLFQALGPKITPSLWMVGDSIFPGQSITGTALGGLNAARQIYWELEKEKMPHALSEYQPSNSIAIP